MAFGNDPQNILLEMVVRETNFGVWDWNPVTNEVLFNETYFSLFGYEKGEFEPSADFCFSLVHPDDLHSAHKGLDTLLAGESAEYECELRMRHKNGHYAWTYNKARAIAWDSEGRATRVLGSRLDINKHKQQEQEQQDALLTIAMQKQFLERAVEERTTLLYDMRRRVDGILAATGSPREDTPCGTLESLGVELGKAFDLITEKMWWYKGVIDSIPLPIFVTDMAQRWTYLNGPALENIGADSLLRVLGEPERLWGEDTDLNLEEGGQICSFSRYNPKSGRFFRGQASFLLDQNGTPIGHIEVMQDVTRMRETEQELRLARDAAEASAHAKSEFLANMSHEIRTPMNAILGMTRLVLGMELGVKQKAYLEKAERAARGLLHIINDILDFSKIDAGKLDMEHTEFRVAEVLISVADMFRETAEAKGLALGLTMSIPESLTVQGDPLRLHQILTNLLSNAIKFTQTGGVYVHAALKERTGNVATFLFRVRDTGIGLSPEQLERMFSAFSQADASTTRRYGGTGLGLVISKRLVELMQGEIYCKSEPGKGAEFFFSAVFGLPNAPCEDEGGLGWQSAPIRDPYRQVAHLAGKQLLVAEDNDINQIVARETLEKAGFVVEIAENGRIAIEMALAKRYDLIFMDIQMPEMDGLTAAEELRRHPNLREIPIVAMTAHAMSGDKEKSLAVGMNDHITKPIDPEKVFAVIAKWLV